MSDTVLQNSRYDVFLLLGNGKHLTEIYRFNTLFLKELNL